MGVPPRESSIMTQPFIRLRKLPATNKLSGRFTEGSSNTVHTGEDNPQTQEFPTVPSSIPLLNVDEKLAFDDDRLMMVLRRLLAQILQDAPDVSGSESLKNEIESPVVPDLVDEDETSDGETDVDFTGFLPSPTDDPVDESNSSADAVEQGTEVQEPPVMVEEPDTDSIGDRLEEDATYYPNLQSFVEHFVAPVFMFEQSSTQHVKWVADWWKYPAIAVRLDAMWRSYEVARTNPGSMFGWHFQAFQFFSLVFDADNGISASIPSEIRVTGKGEPLPCTPPTPGWYAQMLAQIDKSLTPPQLSEDEDTNEGTLS